MKIIDAHIHFRQNTGFDSLAKACGNKNTEAGLREIFALHNIQRAVVMGYHSADKDAYDYPDFLSYCIGLDYAYLESAGKDALATAEQHLKSSRCVGIKLYPGYSRHYIYEDIYRPFYDLAAQYNKPVAIHMGATANSGSQLKYSHPLTVDDVASDFPNTQFVICHFGNPWVLDAAAVMDKNENVSADLSGILDGGRHDIDAFCRDQSGYMDYLRTWIKYPMAFDRFMFATDWPLVNHGDYIDFVSRLIPSQHFDEVFFTNANRIYHLGL